MSTRLDLTGRLSVKLRASDVGHVLVESYVGQRNGRTPAEL